MPIHKFNDENTYDSHVRSSIDSEVSLIENTNEIKYDGVNVEVKYPKFGDALYLENTGNANNLTKHFIDGASLNVSTLPNTWIPVGVVVTNECNKVMVAYYKGYNDGNNITNTVNGICYELTPIIDGQQHSITFQQYAKTNPYNAIEIGTFTHSCSSDEQFVQELDTWLQQHPGGSDSGCYTYNWHCEYLENYQNVMKPFVVCDTCTNNLQYNTVVKTGDTTVKSYNTETITLQTAYKRNNNRNSSLRIGLNYQCLLNYLNTSPAPANFVPSTTVTVTDSNIVSRTQFEENEHCANLRTQFSTFEEYVNVFMLKYPTLKRGVGVELNKSLQYTQLYGNLVYKNLSNTDVIAYPCHYWTQHINFNSDGLRQGDWYLPNITDLYKTLKDVKCRISKHIKF